MNSSSSTAEQEVCAGQQAGLQRAGEGVLGLYSS